MRFPVRRIESGFKGSFCPAKETKKSTPCLATTPYVWTVDLYKRNSKLLLLNRSRRRPKKSLNPSR